MAPPESYMTVALLELRRCAVHGVTRFRLNGIRTARFRCVRCSSEAVAKTRAGYRERLVAEHGGKCTRCGYDGYIGALEFHHRDASEKAFAINAGSGKSLRLMRLEAEKCDLLCANCHREVEAGLDEGPGRNRTVVRGFADRSLIHSGTGPWHGSLSLFDEGSLTSTPLPNHSATAPGTA